MVEKECILMRRKMKMRRKIAKMLVFMLLIGMMGSLGTVQAENTNGNNDNRYRTAISEKTVDKEAGQAAPDSEKTVDKEAGQAASKSETVNKEVGQAASDSKKTVYKEPGQAVSESEETVDKEAGQAVSDSVEAADIDVTRTETADKEVADNHLDADTDSTEKETAIGKEDTETTDDKEKTEKKERSGDGRTYEKKLYKDNTWTGGRPDSDKELKNGATVSFNDGLIMQYSFALSPENIKAIAANPDKTYTLTCPNGLQWIKGSDKDITFNNEDQEEIKFATLKQESGADGAVTASLTFVDHLDDVASDGIEDIFVYLGCRLDKGTLGEPDEPEKCDIILSAGNTLTVAIAENQPRSSALKEKKGKYENGTFTWTITYEPGKKEADLPLTLVDEFDSTYHEYKENSFQVTKKDGTEIADASSDLTVRKDTESRNTRITYKIPQAISEGTDPITITYNTTLTDEGLTSTSNRKVTNRAWLMNSREDKVGAEITGSATFEKVDWLQKESVGGLQEQNGQKYLTWKVTVKTNSKKLSKLILHDQLQNGTEYAVFDENSVRIMAYSNNTQEMDETNGYQHKVEKRADGNGFDLTFNTDNLADQYVVIYNTNINEEYFHGDRKDSFRNQATLDYGWYSDGNGSGDMYEPESPTVIKPIDVDGRMITKAGVGYNPSTHEITWRVVVNPHKLDLTEAFITDATKISGFEQTYVPSSFFLEEGSVIKAGVVSEPADGDATGTLSIKFTNIGTETFAYTFKTTVDNPEDYAYNLQKKTYQNIVRASVKLNQSTGTEEELTVSATGTQDIRSNVLQKKSEDYDYTDHTIGWCITVNENKMPMKSEKGILLEDILAAGLTYVDDSLEVTKEVVSPDGTVSTVSTEKDSCITVNTGFEGDGKQKLTFQYDENEELNDKLFVRFRTKADVDKIDDFKNSTSFSISNTAILKRADYSDLSVSANQKIDNKILAKSGKYDKAQGTITYTVHLNPHGLTLDNTIIRDELPEGLQIDKDTIKLYEATVDKSGAFTKKNTVELTDLLTVNVLERWFEIKLPKGDMPYVLEYITDVTDITENSFSNKISLKGTVSGGAEQGGTDVGLGSGGGGGGGTSSPKVNLTLKKVDAVRPDIKLEGAVFQISDEDGPISEITTDASGKAVFRYLKRGKTYTIKEITPPTGYQEMSKIITIPISSNKDETPKEYEYPEVVTNQPVTGSLSFELKNDAGRILEGAEFTLTDMTTGSKWNRTESSAANGKVTFGEIPYGIYTLKEIKVPEHHILNTIEYRVEVDEKGKVTLINPADTENPDKALTEIVNEAEKASIIVTKIDKDSQKTLEGVKFSLYNSDSEKTLIKTSATDENGIVKFENLEIARSYLIQESVPEGYAAEMETQEVTLTKDGLKLIWENYRVGHVTIIAKDELDKTPLLGVTMGLWHKRKGVIWENEKDTEPYRTVKSDADGSIHFEKLQEGDYWAYMLESPKGYESDECLLEISVTFDSEGKTVIKITNSETGEEIKDGIIDIVPEKPEPEQGTTQEPEKTEPEQGTTEEPEKPGSGQGTTEEPEKPEPEQGTTQEPEKPEPEPGTIEELEKPESEPGTTKKPEKPESKSGTTNKNGSAKESRLPNTGDNTPWMWFLVSALLSGGAIVIMVWYRIFMKKRKK